MKVKNQPPISSEIDAKEKLIVYVYEYLSHSGAKRAAQTFLEEIQYDKEIQFNQQDAPGFLANWWCVFWDLYCAAPEKRNLVEPSSDARAYHEFTMRQVMSPSCTTSPPQQGSFMGGGPGMMGGRYGGAGPPPQLRGGPPPPPVGARMIPIGQGGPPSGPPPMGGGPQFMGGMSYGGQPPRGPIPPRMQGPPPPPPQHMSPMGFGPSPDHVGSSPGLNRMTPVGGPPPQQQTNGPNVTMVGPPQVNSMPPRDGSQGWQGGNVNYNVNSPVNQQMYAAPGSNQPAQPGGQMMMNEGDNMDVKNSPINGGAIEPQATHTEEYVMPVSFGQDTNDQCDSAEIFKLKQSMQDDTAKMFEKEQDFNLDYSDPQNKW